MALVGRTREGILILSCGEDAHVAPVTQHLDEMGVSYRRIDPGASPEDSFVDIEASGGRYQARLSGRRPPRIDFERVTCVWYRRPTDMTPAHGEADTRRFTASNRRALLYGWLQQLRCEWLPAAPLVEDRAANKTYQLSFAKEIGFRIPHTRITASPEALVDMYSRYPQGIIVKPLVPFFNSEQKALQMFTSLVSRRELRAYRAVRHAPMIVQERIPKRFDIRVTVVGEEVFAAAIDSQAQSRTAVDFRHDIVHLRHRVHRLPPAEARRCVGLVKRLGLRFGAIDMILTPAGHYVFLEVNPNGQWLWIEEHTGLPIANAVARCLAGCSASRAKP